ncbi:MAG: chromate resistance protein [Rhodocyclaceae bacterium]|nr:chromate resistance protein [Rhodocyclaceae bacterium]MDZ4214872.1 chromate resistance protein [Rhodocyclaceae bacterium]
MIELVEWLALVTSLPARNKAARMRLWRSLKVLGCATLRDGVYLLPAKETTDAAMQALAEDVRSAEGSAEVLHIAANGAQDASFRQMFDHSADYGTLIETLRRARLDEKSLRRLQRDFAALVSTDYFPAAAQEQARIALSEFAARLSPDEPRATHSTIRRLVSADFSGRTWATRKHLWVDRMASAWLIRRFIDAHASFLWLDQPADCPANALGFDFDGATFSHAGERVTFEVLAASFGLDANPAISRIGAIVHCLDVGGVPVAAAPGIEAVLAGLRVAAPNDDQLLSEASHVFDGLYQHYLQES